VLHYEQIYLWRNAYVTVLHTSTIHCYMEMAQNVACGQIILPYCAGGSPPPHPLLPPPQHQQLQQQQGASAWSRCQ
jgi:hypothetical protein